MSAVQTVYIRLFIKLLYQFKGKQDTHKIMQSVSHGIAGHLLTIAHYLQDDIVIF